MFAGNALTSVNDSTPYNAVFGRTPAILPIFEIINEDGEMSPLTDRMVHRVRELAVAAMVEGTAHKRVLTALRSRSLPSGESQMLALGDAVDYYRPPGNKDVSGWVGDATVKDLSTLKDGLVVLDHKGKDVRAKCGDVRSSLQYLVFHTREVFPGWSVNQAWQYIKNYLESGINSRKLLFELRSYFCFPERMATYAFVYSAPTLV